MFGLSDRVFAGLGGHRAVIILLLALSLLVLTGPLRAQEKPAVQELTGHLELHEAAFYVLHHLKQGQTLYLFAEGTSGDFDPALAVLKPELDSAQAIQIRKRQIDQAIAEGRDPVAVINKVVQRYTLARHDDTGAGYAAAITLKVPSEGDYRLVLTSSPARPTFGSYRLLIGINAPQVVTGRAQPTGAVIASQVKEESPAGKAVQELRGKLSLGSQWSSYNLNEFFTGDTLYILVEATSGDLKPRLTLFDFDRKPLVTGNFSGQNPRAELKYTFRRDTKNCRLRIDATAPDGTVTTGNYRLLLGLNQPEVLQGQGKSEGRAIVRQPIPVKIGLKMQQITGVNQREEHYGVVSEVWMEWRQPDLAFRADTVQRHYKLFTGDSFRRYMSQQGLLWPDYTLFNQQGKRWTQNLIVFVQADGSVFYFERFSATLQAPNFDFRRLPFDTQGFFIRMDSIYPESFFIYQVKPGFSEVGKRLGEEEWMVTKFDTVVRPTMELYGLPTSSFMFRFWAQRHLNYYIFRIFLPLFIIIIVSWVIFFLKDYGRRVDAAAGNLLLFIAFNFVISQDLPRLGYMTFLDMMLISTFLVTALVLFLAVALKRLVTDGKETLVLRIDRYFIIFYPLAYIGTLLTVILFSVWWH
ncbi:MAG: hypothetical protein P8168_13750 [Deltaproteobacteria bacterium]